MIPLAKGVEADNVAPPGFVSLFNGWYFSGWRVPEGDGGHWKVIDGITVRGDRVTVVLDGIKVIDEARLPGTADSGPIALQHHGGKRNGQWISPPSLVQFKNIFVKEL